MSKRKPHVAPIPPPPQKLITAPDDDTTYAHQQAAQRQETWHAAGEMLWQGKKLKPWSRERDSLYVRLISLDESTYDLDNIPKIQQHLQDSGKDGSLEGVIDPLHYIEQAALILFLASHEEEAWDHLRGRPAFFLRAANQWAATNIPLGQEWPAIHLALQIRTQHRALIPITVPGKGSSGGSSGN
jgi:hypothetical protein